MGADIKYSVSFFILFFYFLCLFLGAYHNAAVRANCFCMGADTKYVCTVLGAYRWRV